MLLRPRNPAHADDLLGRWFAERSEKWWQANWKLAVYQGLILVAVHAAWQPLHHRLSYCSPAFERIIMLLGLHHRAHYLLSGLLTLAYIALPTVAAVNLLTFVKPHPILRSTLAPQVLRQRMLAAARNIFFCWLGLGGIIPTHIVALTIWIITTPDLKNFWNVLPWDLATGVVSCLFYQELAVAVFLQPWPRRLKLAAFLAAVPLASWGMRELRPFVDFKVYDAIHPQLWSVPSPELRLLIIILFAMIVRLLPAFLLFGTNQFPDALRVKAPPPQPTG